MTAWNFFRDLFTSQKENMKENIMSKIPPIPPQNRPLKNRAPQMNEKNPPINKEIDDQQLAQSEKAKAIAQEKNIKQNTVNQGRQQDR